MIAGFFILITCVDGCSFGFAFRLLSVGNRLDTVRVQFVLLVSCFRETKRELDL